MIDAAQAARNGSEYLLIDADDTLWENHAYFLTVHRRFLETMGARGHDPERTNQVLREIEARRTRNRGYGSRNYALSLVETVEFLEKDIEPRFRQRLMEEGDFIHNHPVELFPGVLETLELLARRHLLLLVTKGNLDEQRRKIARSGLSPCFQAVEILAEKCRASYTAVVRRHQLPLDRSWMIGNSPRSDINPAFEAGLKTVYLPHRSLWELEAEDFAHPPGLRLQRFRELLDHF